MKRLATAFFMALLLMIFGCANIVSRVADVGRPEYRFKVEKNVMVPMSDGTMLATDVYIPKGLGRAPAILIRTPYSKGTKGDLAPLNLIVTRLFAGQGYIVVIQDCRGRFDSEGEFYSFLNEEQDGHDAVAWVLAQPWSNGMVATWGPSYLGYTQWAAGYDSPHLDAMVPMVTTADMTSVLFEGGAINYQNMLGWSTTNVGKGQNKYSARRLEKSYWTLPILEADDALLGKTVQFYDDIVTRRVLDILAITSYDDKFQRVSAPVLSIAGWYDLFAKYQIEDFQRLKAEGQSPARKMSKIIVGPWGHGFFQNPPVKFPDGGIIKLGQLGRTLDFYGQLMKGEDNGVESWPDYTIFVMGRNEWIGLEQWPPPEVSVRPMYLVSSGHANSSRGDGSLSWEDPSEEADEDYYIYDPQDPVPTAGGPLLGADLGPKKQNKIEERADVLVYTSEEMTSPLTIIGPVSVTLYASSDAVDTDFTAKLCDVYPDGTSINLTDGIIRARFRDGDLKKPELIEPGKTYEYEIDLWNTAHAFMPGHKARLQISSSNFPRFDRNLNTGEDVASGSSMEEAGQTIFHDAERPSRINLPVVPE